MIRTENKNPLLSGAKFQIACDVKNPLCGKQGATYIFGPQKGVTEEQKEQVDEAMRHYADVTKESLDCDFADCEGASAAEDSDMHSFRILRRINTGCGTDFAGNRHGRKNEKMQMLW